MTRTWAAEAPQELLAALAVRRSWPGGRYRAPDLASFPRVLQHADADAVDAVIGSFLAEIAGFASLVRTDGDPVRRVLAAATRAAAASGRCRWPTR